MNIFSAKYRLDFGQAFFILHFILYTALHIKWKEKKKPSTQLDIVDFGIIHLTVAKFD